MTNEPRPPVRCERHGDDYVDITLFGGPRKTICVECGADPGDSADTLYAAALEKYEARKLEYDRLTPRILEVEAELRGAREVG
jgi:hypothetical protein